MKTINRVILAGFIATLLIISMASCKKDNSRPQYEVHLRLLSEHNVDVTYQFDSYEKIRHLTFTSASAAMYDTTLKLYGDNHIKLSFFHSITDSGGNNYYRKFFIDGNCNGYVDINYGDVEFLYRPH